MFLSKNIKTRAGALLLSSVHCVILLSQSAVFPPCRSAVVYTPNANMADRSVAAWNELHESEASEASVFCFDNAFIVKSWLFVAVV